MKLYFLSLTIIFIGSIVSIFFKNSKKPIFVFYTLLLSSIFGFIPSFGILLSGRVSELRLFVSYPIGDLLIRIDSLSAFFLIIVYAGSVLTSLYAVDYLKNYIHKGQFNLMILSFMFLVISMLILLTMQNIFAFLIVWEMMSVTSFLAILFENDREEVKRAAAEYFIYMHVAVVLIITGFLLLYNKSHSTDIMMFKSILNERDALSSVVFLILFFGFGIKAGFVPFHNWLPKAHPASLSQISGFMSGVMLKMGIYGIIRIALFLNNPAPFVVYTVIAVSSVTALFGILNAIFENDIKRLLAYSSIENIGLIGIGIGLGLLGRMNGNALISVFGFGGALLHSLNHSLFKPLLFFGAGNIYIKTHTRNIEKLGGLIKVMPYTSALFILGSIAISGLPLLNGFVSEFILYLSSIEGVKSFDIQTASVSVLILTVIAFVGVMALICFTKVIGVMILGVRREEKKDDIKDDMKMSLSSMWILSLMAALIGLLPQYALLMIKQLIMQIGSGKGDAIFQTMRDAGEKISFVSIVFVIIFISLYLIRRAVLKNRIVRADKVWNCGYQNYSPKIQYTGTSFVEPLKNITSILIVEKNSDNAINEYFPLEKSVSSAKGDIFEKYLINPSVKILKKVFDRFSGIQKGSTQQYLLMGMIFLIISLLIILWT